MQTVSITNLVAEQLDLALKSGHGRSAHTIHGGHDQRLRQTVLALLAGSELAEHESPGEATLQVLHGHVELTVGVDSWTGETGDLVTIPPERHALTALTDAVILLTVSKAEVGLASNGADSHTHSATRARSGE